MTGVCALALFSGGLDSILACRVVAAQGIAVKAIKFVSPFFGYEVLDDPEGYRKEMLRKYGISVLVEDISAHYLHLLSQYIRYIRQHCAYHLYKLWGCILRQRRAKHIYKLWGVERVKKFNTQ